MSLTTSLPVLDIPATKEHESLLEDEDAPFEETDNLSPSSLFSKASSEEDFPWSEDVPRASAQSPQQDASPPSAPNGDRLSESKPAHLICPPIPGLHFNPACRISQNLAEDVVSFCMERYFNHPSVNQIMLFSRASDTLARNSQDRLDSAESTSCTTSSSGLPPPLQSLLSAIEDLLRPHLPPDIYDVAFQAKPGHARQAILNLYNPGEGISPHVDLLRRYADGIVGVSLQGTCVMDFVRCTGSSEDSHSSQYSDEGWSEYGVFLPERSVIVLTGDARYNGGGQPRLF
jgi:hypothetical protein